MKSLQLVSTLIISFVYGANFLQVLCMGLISCRLCFLCNTTFFWIWAVRVCTHGASYFGWHQI